MSPESMRGSAYRHWKLNWWDLWSLVDGEQRPIQWTTNSLILSPHPSSPVVLARAFPSSSTFSLPSPNPVLNNPGGYSPPSVIEASPSDEYIFAFFDGKGNDSVACIWHREETIDAWKINIFWHPKPGQGVILAKWIGEERTWLHTTPPTRAPPLGPANQFGKITLLLVNQSQTVLVVHRPSPSFQFQLLSASLRHASEANVGDRAAMGETSNGPGGLSVCVRAAIGMGYNESSIIVATSSTLIPPVSVSLSEFSNPFGVAGTSAAPATTSPQSSWETFGPEQIVRLCEVKLTAHGYILGISTTPMPPLFPPTASSSRLTNILMVPYLPQLEDPSSPEGSVVDKGAASSKTISSPLLHIVLSFLDFENYTSPRCELMSFELQKNKNATKGPSKFVAWSHRHLATRTITTSAVSFLLPSRSPGDGLVMAGLLDLEGVAPRPSHTKENGRPKEIRIGKVVVLKVPDLEDDSSWEPSILMTGAEDAETDPPITATVSPGGSLICTSPAVWSGASKIGIQAYPRYLSSSDVLSVPQMTESLLSTLLADRPPTDVLHSLLNPSLPLSSVTDVIERTLKKLECEEFVTRDLNGTILGIMVEIFRSRSKRLSEDNPAECKEKASLEERWHVAMDLCSVKALVGAFEACHEDDDSYDLEPVWQLIGLATWLVDFAERLLRTCVLWEGDFSLLHNPKDWVAPQKTQENQKDAVKVKMEAMDIDRDNLFDGELSPEPTESMNGASPQLLHVLHPFTLDNLTEGFSHLVAFRSYLDTLQASGVKAAIAKDVLVDVLECSGINFKELVVALNKVKNELKSIDDDVLRRSLCSLTPQPSTYDVLWKICKHMTSENAVSKPRLFIKPADLVDGISKLSLAAAKMNQERDIVSKGVLGLPGTTRMCARCKGRTDTGQTPLPRGKETGEFGRWAVWEHEWEKCICGGLWLRDRSR